MTLKLIESTVNLAVIQLLRAFANRLKQKRFRVELRIDAEQVKDDSWRRTVVTGTDNVTVAKEEDELALVVVVECCEGIDCLAKRLLALSVTGDLTDDKLVQGLGVALSRELKGSKD